MASTLSCVSAAEVVGSCSMSTSQSAIVQQRGSLAAY